MTDSPSKNSAPTRAASRKEKALANRQLRRKVQDAVRALEQEGRRATGEAVRGLMGGGSFTDISTVLKVVLAERSAREDALRQVPDMTDTFLDLAKEFHAEIYRLVDGDRDGERKTHAAEIARRDDEIAERDLVIEEVEDERDDALAQVEDLRGQIAASHETLEERDALIASMRLELARLEGRLEGRLEAQHDAEGATADDTGPEGDVDEEGAAEAAACGAGAEAKWEVDPAGDEPAEDDDPGSASGEETDPGSPDRVSPMIMPLAVGQATQTSADRGGAASA